MSALSRFNPKELAALERLAGVTGHSPEELANEFAASYMRLILDAPKAIPDKRPLLGLVQRLGWRK